MTFLRTRLLTTVLTCALATLAVPALGAGSASAALPCLDVAGVVQVGCSGTAPAKGACANESALPTAANLARIRKATLCLVNRQRAKRHLRPFVAQSTLGRVANRFAGELVREHFFDHTSPTGKTMLARIKSTSYLTGALSRWWVGENIAYGTGPLATPKAIVNAWMHSTGHRANILDSHFREIGLGVALGSPDGPDGATYVHDFGRRMR
jgi:uncharacterized protein YkwD